MAHTTGGVHADGDQPTPLSELSAGRVWGMLESAPDAMVMTDGDGRILAVNQQVEKLFGYDRVDLLGREIEMLLPERARDVHRAHRVAYRAEPSVRAMGEGLELHARRSDGSDFSVEVSLSPLIDDEGLAVVASIRDVTDRKRLTAHTRRVQAAVNSIHDGVFMFEPATLEFVYANEGASSQTGYSNAELLTMTPIDIKPEFTRERFESLIAPLIAGEVGRLSFRTIHRGKSGTDVPVDIVLEHLRTRGDQSGQESSDDAEEDALLVAIVRDVTEQVAVERQLLLSEETFRRSFEHAPVGMTMALVAADGQRTYERVNSSFAQMLGRSIESLVGVDFVDISHPHDRQQSIDAATEMARGERDAFITEKRFLCADGTHVWTLVHETVIERSDGTRTLAHVVDITDRRERLAEHERMTTMEDRERIARDIHDLVIQRLFGAGMKLQAVIPEMASDLAVARTHETIDELDTTIRELRSAIFSLHRNDDATTVTDDLTLSVAQGVDHLGFQPALVVAGPLDSISARLSTELRATVREALSNVARHAQASAVEVRIDVSDTALALTVTDNGCGLDPGHPHGHGLKNMANRAARFGGDFSVSSPDAGGCVVNWSTPI